MCVKIEDGDMKLENTSSVIQDFVWLCQKTGNI